MAFKNFAKTHLGWLEFEMLVKHCSPKLIHIQVRKLILARLSQESLKEMTLASIFVTNL